MGKTESGAVWLDKKFLSSYDYWQFWRNIDDRDVLKFLKIFTDLNFDEIEKKDIREFVDKYLLAKDARALRLEYNRVNPDVDLTVFPEGFEEGVDLPITLAFFWPDSRL